MVRTSPEVTQVVLHRSRFLRSGRLKVYETKYYLPAYLPRQVV